jgi:hypothetical protein
MLSWWGMKSSPGDLIMASILRIGKLFTLLYMSAPTRKLNSKLLRVIMQMKLNQEPLEKLESSLISIKI